MERIKKIVFGLFFGTFALFFGIATIPANISGYNETKKLYESKKYKVIEGVLFQVGKRKNIILKIEVPVQ